MSAGDDNVVGLSLLGINKHLENSPLLLSAMNSDTETAVKLLDESNNSIINDMNSDGETALIISASTINTRLVKILLERGADCNIASKFGTTALIWAARRQSSSLLEILLEHTTNLDSQAEDGATALTELIIRGNWVWARRLIERGAGVNLQSIKSGNSPLLWALEKGDMTTAEMLIDRGADLEAKNHVGQTPLLLAAHGRRRRIVEMLIQRGVELNNKSSLVGHTALIASVIHSELGLVTMLLEGNCDPDIYANNGDTALIFATQMGNIELVRLLLQYRPNLDKSSEYK